MHSAHQLEDPASCWFQLFYKLDAQDLLDIDATITLFHRWAELLKPKNTLGFLNGPFSGHCETVGMETPFPIGCISGIYVFAIKTSNYSCIGRGINIPSFSGIRHGFLKPLCFRRILGKTCVFLGHPGCRALWNLSSAQSQVPWSFSKKNPPRVVLQVGVPDPVLNGVMVPLKVRR